MKRVVLTIFRLFSAIVTFFLVVYFALDLIGIDPYSLGFPLGNIVEPLLNPVRRVVPAVAGIDFSPLIVILLFAIIEWILRSMWGNDGAI